jgi:hypothetical protein
MQHIYSYCSNSAAWFVLVYPVAFENGTVEIIICTRQYGVFCAVFIHCAFGFERSTNAMNWHSAEAVRAADKGVSGPVPEVRVRKESSGTAMQVEGEQK